MKQKLKQHKGITLIALIITIIVLLILAVVAIIAVKGDGIISHAKNAKAQYSGAQTNEQDVLSGYELILAQETGNAWRQEKTNVKKGDTTLEVGDYVNYVSGVSGYTDANGWKVLGVENGQLLLMSTAFVKEAVNLCGRKMYYNDAGIKYLNDVCLQYGQGNGATRARSIKAEDIDRITGFTKGEYKEGKLEDYGNIVTYTLGEDGETLSYTVEGRSELNGSKKLSGGITFFCKPNGENLKVGESYKADQNTYYSYKVSTYLPTTSKAYKMLCENKSEYWLGSSYVSTHSNYVSLGLRTMLDDEVLSRGDLWLSGER